MAVMFIPCHKRTNCRPN